MRCLIFNPSVPFFFFFPILIALLLSPGVALCESPGKEELVTKVIRHSGMDKAIGSIPAQIESQYLQRKTVTKNPEANRKVTQILLENFNADRANKVFFGNVLVNSSQAHLQEMVRWLESALGKKITAAESKMLEADFQDHLMKYASEIRTHPPSEERIALIRRLEKSAQLTDSSIHAFEVMLRGMLTGFQEFVPDAEKPPDEEINRKIEDLKSIMRPMMWQQLVVTSHYLYRNFTDDQIEQYIGFLDTKAGEEYVQLSLKGVEAVYNDLFETAFPGIKDATAKTGREIETSSLSSVGADYPTKRWIQDSKGCKFLDPDARYSVETITWSGQCVNGYVEGTGKVLFLRRGWSFEGKFRAGLILHGKGIRTNGTYEGEFKDNLADGTGVLTFKAGDTYSGEFKNGEPNGKISIKYRNGGRFEGTSSSEGRYDGIMFYADGNKYEGSFIRGKREGRGKNMFPNGDVYEGNFTQDQINGTGILRYSAGAVYEGEFVNGAIQGRGKLRYVDGGIYEGEFVGGRRQGRGKLTLPNGDVYEGNFMQDGPHGRGIMRFSNGASYEGEFAGGLFQGHGRFRYADGGIYEGGFIGGRRHGQGEYHGNNGDVIKGEWSHDQLHGQGVENLANGIHYEGSFVGGRHQGKGRLVDSKKGFTYEGEFLNDLFDGRGAFKSNDGYMYEGQLSRGLQDGIGIETTKNGDHYEGAFEQGARNGQGILRGKRDQVEFTYEGQFKKGMADGLGAANVGGVIINGEFRDNVPWKAVYTLIDGQKYEIDREEQKVLKIGPDGKKEDINTNEQFEFRI